MSEEMKKLIQYLMVNGFQATISELREVFNDEVLFEAEADTSRFYIDEDINDEHEDMLNLKLTATLTDV